MANNRSSNNRLMGFLQRLVGPPAPIITTTTLGTDRDTSLSEREQDAIIRRISQATSPAPQRSGDSYAKYIRPMARRIADLRLDARIIEKLAPEITKACEIVVPSIISPTDMRDGEISIKSTTEALDEDTNAKISSVLHEHFNGHLKLSEKLPDWIKECLYGAGSQPLLVLPITEIDTIISDPTAVISKTKVYARENLSTQWEKVSRETESRIAAIESKSILGIADCARRVPDPKHSTLDAETLKPAVESAVSTFLQDLASAQKKPDGLYDFAAQWSKTSIGNNRGLKHELQMFATAAIEAVSIDDNPDVLKLDRARKSAKSAEITSRLVNNYSLATLITVNPETKPSVGDPVIYELAPESVIPVFTPGTPSDHLGYFIVLDEFGNPVRTTEDSPVVNLSDNRQVTPASLYKAFGFDDTYALKGGQLKVEQDILMMNIYQTIIDAHLKSRLKSNGLSNLYIGAPSSVYRCMFARYLSLRKTRLLFVPRDLMTYMCFRYNDDGTGRSKIEDIKFVLSLKITLLICRIMASMNNAINRKTLTINFAENMGDPIAFMQMAEKEYLDKMVTNFTYDPTEITRTLAQRSLTIKARNLPGAEAFDIASEPNEGRDTRPDDGLMEDLSNMMILQLDVPASAYNMLGEHEFSRSIASNNLFFSRRIAAYQKPVCAHVARHVQLYTGMSKTLKDKIAEILSAGKSSREKKQANDTGTAEERSEKIDDQVADVIRHIKASLPSPSVAPNKTEFEELDAIITALNTAFEAVFDNDLGSTDDNPIAVIRALVKSAAVRDYMNKIGILRDVTIPQLDDPTFLSKLFTDHKLALINISKGLKQSTTMTQPDTDTDTSTSGGGQPF